MEQREGYVLRKERLPGGHEMVSAFTPGGAYIGNDKMAKFLVDKKGIAPQLRPGSKVCSIGKSSLDGRWYGWSHRAICGFKVGSSVKKGDCAYRPDKGEWTAKTPEDAKQMAIDFAADVS